ncbi:hypothetical protein V6N13_087295 [Hibiscus sabdariffa]|uniref:Uncharacterized protein n=1 Tax=Hibiscus sabdariffa TaxID=183260 RepID=A0ABR2FW01_9ROSI
MALINMTMQKSSRNSKGFWILELFINPKEEAKEPWYSLNGERKVKFYSNGYFSASVAAQWRDIFALIMLNNLKRTNPSSLQCRDAVTEYLKHITQPKETIAELLLEALVSPLTS